MESSSTAATQPSLFNFKACFSPEGKICYFNFLIFSLRFVHLEKQIKDCFDPRLDEHVLYFDSLFRLFCDFTEFSVFILYLYSWSLPQHDLQSHL